MFPYGTVELEHPEKGVFKVNGQRLKHYLGEKKIFEEREELNLIAITNWAQKIHFVETTMLNKSAWWEATHAFR